MIFPAHKTVSTLRNLVPDALLISAAPTEASSYVQSDLIEIMDLEANTAHFLAVLPFQQWS